MRLDWSHRDLVPRNELIFEGPTEKMGVNPITSPTSNNTSEINSPKHSSESDGKKETARSLAVTSTNFETGSQLGPGENNMNRRISISPPKKVSNQTTEFRQQYQVWKQRQNYSVNKFGGEYLKSGVRIGPPPHLTAQQIHLLHQRKSMRENILEVCRS